MILTTILCVVAVTLSVVALAVTIPMAIIANHLIDKIDK